MEASGTQSSVPATTASQATEGGEASVAVDKGEASHPTLKNPAKRKREDGSSQNNSCRSAVWEHFEKFDEPITKLVDGKEEVIGHSRKAKCMYCFTIFKADSSYNGTSTLRRHIENVCEQYPGRTDLEDGQKILTSEGTSNSVVMRQWSPDACTDAAVVMIVMDELPFNHVEKEGFKYFCSVAIPRWEIPSRRAIVRKFLEMYDAKKEELRSELSKPRVCLTTDTWTSLQNVNYIVLTSHFIDMGWNLHKRILNFCVIPNHQGTTIGKILETCLVSWKIDQVMTISVDNAAANKHAVEYVRKKMMNWTVPPILGGQHIHVRCLAHILNLIVRSGLSILDKSVASIRNVVRYVRSSSSRLDTFKMCVEKEILDVRKVCILDVPTRWNSTFLMLETVMELRKAFDRLAEEEEGKYSSYFDEDEDLEEEIVYVGQVVEDPKSKTRRKRVGPPTEEDWEKAAIFCKFLPVFYEVTLRISATMKPTAQSAFHDIVSIECEINGLFLKPGMAYHNETESLMARMAVKMKNKFEKYFGNVDDVNQLLLVALVLDPRYELRNVGSVCRRMLGMEDGEVKVKVRKLKELIVAMTDIYAASTSTPKQKVTTTETQSARSVHRGVSGKMAEMMEDWDKELAESDEVVVESEVDRYLIDPFEKSKDGEPFEILDWWKHNGLKYPNLQAVARDVLAIQVSTVASESCFSTGKRVIDPHRCSLTPRSVEALICLQNWLKSPGIMALEYVPTLEEVQLYEEIEKDYQNRTPMVDPALSTSTTSKPPKPSKSAKSTSKFKKT